MAVLVKVEATGIDGLRLKLANPEHVREPMRKFLRTAGNIGRADVRPRIPIRRGGTLLRHGKPSAPGRGRRSVRIKLRLSSFEVSIFSPLYYVRFLAAGTKRGIVARQMFLRSAQAIGPKVQALAQDMVREITGRIKGGTT